MIETVLFDLDGTLLPMDQEKFTRHYVKNLVMTVAHLGYDPKKLAKTIMEGSREMENNDGTRTNSDAFWDYFCSVYGEDARKDIPAFQSFYRNEFNESKVTCGFDPVVPKAIKALKKAGYRLGVASNPLIPTDGVTARIKWAGLNPLDFDFSTSYETSSYSKPNPDFLLEIAEQHDLDPATCLMVGNGMDDDILPAEKIGMQVFLIVRDGDPEQDAGNCPTGDFNDLLDFLGVGAN